MPQTINLGFSVPDYSKCEPVNLAGAEGKETPTRTAYPSMTIPGNDGLARSLKAGQTVTALVEFRVTGVTIRDRDPEANRGYADEYGGTRVELDARTITFEGIKVEEGADEEDGKSAFEKFRKKKAMTRNSAVSDDDGDGE